MDLSFEIIAHAQMRDQHKALLALMASSADPAMLRIHLQAGHYAHCVKQGHCVAILNKFTYPTGVGYCLSYTHADQDYMVSDPSLQDLKRKVKQSNKIKPYIINMKYIPNSH